MLTQNVFDKDKMEEIASHNLGEPVVREVGGRKMGRNDKRRLHSIEAETWFFVVS